MKSERRHELQHNELADWLIKAGEDIKPYQNLILLAAVLGLVGMAGYSWWSRWSAEENALAWNEFNTGLETSNLEILTKVIEQRPGTTVAGMAAVVSADSRLAQGCNQLFSSKELANREINAAMELYAVGLDPSQPSSVRQQAAFGLARAKEAKGELEPAARQYRELIEKWPNGAYASEAKQRLEDLKQFDTKRMFDDLRKFDPKPVFDEPLAEPGRRPNADLDALPDDPAKLNVEKKTEEKDKPKTEGEKK